MARGSEPVAGIKLLVSNESAPSNVNVGLLLIALADDAL